MAMSDCVKCWNTTCSCGHDYRDWSRERRIEYAAVMLGVTESTIVYSLGMSIPVDHPRKEEE